MPPPPRRSPTNAGAVSSSPGIGTTHARSRRPKLDVNFCYKLVYFVGNAVVLGLVYGLESSSLYASNNNRNVAVEFWLWLAVAASWVAYLNVQGSNPGYVTTASAEFAVKAAAEHMAAEAAMQEQVVPVSMDAPGMRTSATQHAGSVSVEADHVAGARGGAAASSGAATTGLTSSEGASTRASDLELFHDASHDDDSAPIARALERNTLVTLFGAPSRRNDAAIADAELDFHPTTNEDVQHAVAEARSGVRTCKWCQQMQPARAHHCRQCNRCVHTFDHHCGFIHTCIGERNHARFWWYCLAQTIAICFIIGVVNSSFVWRRDTATWLAVNIVSILLLIVLWLSLLFMGGLTLFHGWLACTNTTTLETMVSSNNLWYLAGTDTRECDLPYSRGTFANVRIFCCARRGCCTNMPCRRKRIDTWQPLVWAYPSPFDRESGNVTNNIWENRYWSCC